MSWEILTGDCCDTLAQLPASSVHTVVTSPPYFGLRDYGTGEWEGGDETCDHIPPSRPRDERPRNGLTGGVATVAAQDGGSLASARCRCGATRKDRQIGLEPTPDEFVQALVEVFRSVRRVLRDDGTVWLNLGDSYAAGTGGPRTAAGATAQAGNTQRGVAGHGYLRVPDCKPKDLIGIPWLVAFALRQPYYDGKITNELDRVWLAAMIDAEGCIFVHHRHPAGDRKSHTYGPGLEVANTSRAVVERCMALTGVGSISAQDKDRRQTLYRWTCRTEECRSVLREAYPYLVAKQQQARLAIGCPSNGPQAEAAWEALKLLHGGSDTTVDFKAPPSLHTPGWYLRSDVIWAKPNPMPESVTDRPTRSHEFIFLLTKSSRYFYDADSIREGAQDWGRRERSGALYDGEAYPNGNGQSGLTNMDYATSGRNKRDVWTVSTKPYAGAHFATFPPDLIEPCVLAGCPERACSACGAPWERIVEVTKSWREDAYEADQAYGPGSGNRMVRPSNGGMSTSTTQTLGFEPSCECNADPAPGVVLDPFAGAGTTGIVAVRNRRSFIGLELNPEYAQMARDRITLDITLGHRAPQRVETPADQLDLLGGMA